MDFSHRGCRAYVLNTSLCEQLKKAAGPDVKEIVFVHNGRDSFTQMEKEDKHRFWLK